MSESSVLALFDFDKTLISRDSFRLLAEIGARSFFERWLLFLYAGITKLGWIDNRRYKGLVLDRIWRGRSLGEFGHHPTISRPGNPGRPDPRKAACGPRVRAEDRHLGCPARGYQPA